MIYMYPDNSYFSQTGVACRCHDSSCSYDGYCDCIPFERSLQCMAFAKLAYNRLHNKSLNNSDLVLLGSNAESSVKLTRDLAISLFMDNTHHNLGTYIRVKPKNSGYQHSIAIINTDIRGLTIYHANYGGNCRVRYQYYTWDDFVGAFPYIYYYAK